MLDNDKTPDSCGVDYAIRIKLYTKFILGS